MQIIDLFGWNRCIVGLRRRRFSRGIKVTDASVVIVDGDRLIVSRQTVAGAGSEVVIP